MTSHFQLFQAWLSTFEEIDRFSSSQKLTLLSVNESQLDSLGTLASQWALKTLKDVNSHLCLFLRGPLGAGKTRFSQAFIGQFMQNATLEIESPTYAYLIPYENKQGIQLQHFDLYRLRNADHLLELGLEEKWQQPGISLIEWPDVASKLAPWPRLNLTIAYETADTRNLTWQWDFIPNALEREEV